MAGTTRHEFGGVSCFFINNDNIKNFGDPYWTTVKLGALVTRNVQSFADW